MIKEEQLKSIILSGSLLEITFYHVNDYFFELPDKGFWLIDGGMELRFPNGVISAAFDSETKSFVIKNTPVNKIYKNDNLIELRTNEISNLDRFLSLSVHDVIFRLLEFEYIVDYTMKTKKEDRYVQMILKFENKEILQIAFVNYELISNQAPKRFMFDLNNDILVSTNEVIQINK